MLSTKLSIRLSHLFLIFILSAFSASKANALIINLSTTNNSVDVNQPISLQVWASDLDPDIITAYDFDIGYDNSLVSFVGATFGDLLGFNSFGSIADAVDFGSSVNVGEVSFLSDAELTDLQVTNNPSGMFMLAQLDFTSLAAGVANFNIMTNSAFGQGFFGANFISYDQVINTASVDVTISQQAQPVSVAPMHMFFVGMFALLMLLRANARQV